MADTPGGASALETILGSSSAEVIHEYLELMEDSEPPRAYLTWTLIAAAAALSGKNSILRAGPVHTVKPNLFIILLGPAGVRKTSAIRMIEGMLKHTSLNIGPTDSGGVRHGLMSALVGLHRPHFHPIRRHADQGPLIRAMVNPRVSSDMVLFAPELGRLFASSSREMADFMVDLYDGSKIDYETKAGNTEINAPLVTLLGATTPSSLAEMIPANAGTHGVLSRMIFIYENKAYKKVPLPKEQDQLWWDARQRIINRFDWIDNNRMDFSMTSQAREFFTHVYEYSPLIEDPRLDQYRERRADILQRVSMALCALRQDCQVIESDLELAHELLKLAEPKMHEALKYFGRNKVYVGRMLIINYLRAKPDHMASRAELISAASSELRQSEADEALQDMIASGEIVDFTGTFVLGELKNEVVANKRKGKTSR